MGGTYAAAPLLRAAVAGDDGVAEVLVELRECRCAEHDLIVRLDRVPGQDRRRERRVRLGEQRRDGLAVDLDVGVVEAGPGRDVGVMGEEVLADRRELAAPGSLRSRSVQFHPYSRGCETSVWSPLPKVSVAATTATARTVPSSAERTGAAVWPRPRSSANRSPVTAVGDMPVAAAAVATRDAGETDASAFRRARRPLGSIPERVDDGEDHERDDRARRGRRRARSSRTRSRVIVRADGPVRSA